MVEEFRGELWSQDERTTGFGDVNRIPGERGVGLCRTPNLIHFGGNSGFQVLNLAYHMGARRITLLGYDMQRTGGKSHWHGDHPEGLTNGNLFDDWVQQFAPLAAGLREAGVQVLNASRQSALECFPRVTLEEALCHPSPASTSSLT